MAAQRPHRLFAFLDGRRAGVFVQDPQLTFEYDADYLADPGATPLSSAMPLAAGRYRQRIVLPWLDGLLPDDQAVRDRWAAGFGVSARNPFALLTRMGLDTPGAVQLHLGETLDEPVGQLVPLDERALGDRLRALRTEPAAWTVEGERWSLGGAQSKLALRWDGGWNEAIGDEPTTHILKPGVAGFRAQGLNEHLTMTAARSLGLPTAVTQYAEFDGEPAVIVTRFDRRERAGRIVRAHQEDACMALSVSRNRKYEQDGGPGAAQIIDLLRGTSDPVDGLHRFIDALAFNYLVGASDGHAKNYSILLGGRGSTLAPLYDVASSLPYDAEPGSGLRTLAMAIGGERRFGRVRRPHWDRLARRAGIDAEQLWLRVSELAGHLPDALASAIAATPLAAASDLPARYLDRLSRYLTEAGFER
ncbi:MAG: type II toxin-antitoxin system HipA family toxin [Micropruina sp.]|uniref:type II toxin-antitoxin system HipA family toxin n=1 Tax=Micropruina sp. TaxID=2737536 RepID=UPI0039E63531